MVEEAVPSKIAQIWLISNQIANKKSYFQLVEEAVPSKMAQIWLISNQIANKKSYFQTQFKENFLQMVAF